MLALGITTCEQKREDGHIHQPNRYCYRSVFLTARLPSSPKLVFYGYYALREENLSAVLIIFVFPSVQLAEQPLPAQPREDRLVQTVLSDKFRWFGSGLLVQEFIATGVMIGDFDFGRADGAGKRCIDTFQMMLAHEIQRQLPRVDVQREVGLGSILGPGRAPPMRQLPP